MCIFTRIFTMRESVVCVMLLVALAFGIVIEAGDAEQSAREGRFFSLQNILKTDHTKKPFLQNRIQELVDKMNSFENIAAQLDDVDGIVSLIAFFKHKACPPGTNSFAVGSQCYQYSRDLWMSYDDALSFCQARGGQLLRPDLNDPYLYPNLQKLFPLLGENSLLVGVTDLLDEGTFTFFDGTQLPPDAVLQKATPRKERDCVSLSKRNGYFTLRDVSCSFRHQFICQYDFVDLLAGTS